MKFTKNSFTSKNDVAKDSLKRSLVALLISRLRQWRYVEQQSGEEKHEAHNRRKPFEKRFCLLLFPQWWIRFCYHPMIEAPVSSDTQPINDWMVGNLISMICFYREI